MNGTRHLPRAVALAIALACGPGVAPAAAPRVIDAFEDPAAWAAFPADGVELKLSGAAGEHGRCLRLDFRFSGGGYAIARRRLSLDLPDNYAFTFRLRGDAPPEQLEFKLIDASGENVWWHVERDVTFPHAWQTVTIRKRQIAYAWGPAGGGELRHAAALEFAVTAGSGGAGTVWLDQLELRELPPEGTPPPAPIASASSSRQGQPPASALDDDPATAWAPAANDRTPWLALDLGAPREFGGLVLDWLPGRHAIDYDLEAAGDDGAWRPLQQVRGGNGGRDWLYLPDTEASRLRLRVLASATAAGPALAALTSEPPAWSATREAFCGAIAQASPRGLYPRGIRGEQPFWTIVGQDDDTREGLLGEDGALELRPGGPSVEPFLFVDDRLLTWADVSVSQSLEGADLPIPTVTWRAGALRLAVTVFAVGEPEASSLVARYRVANTGATPVTPTLFLALRPFQVDPPSQFLNLRGGCATLRDVALAPLTARVEGDTAFVCLTPPAAAGASTFAGGDIVADHLTAGLLPAAQGVTDEEGAASAAFAWPLALLPGEEAETALVVPLHPGALAALPGGLPPPGDDAAVHAWVADALRRCGNAWRAKVDAVRITLPPSAAPLAESIRAQLGWILVTRAGPALQPGARSYARSWIRDGALTASALRRLGLPGPAREFAEWYAPYQYPSGKIPCVVDARGADPVPEHDSSGEFIFMVAEDYRHTADRDFAARMWPCVRAAAAYLDSLRHARLGAAWDAPDQVEYRGLLPPSISHEGYSAKPMHSYWDDFFALRGFRDAAFLAGALGDEPERARWGGVATAFAHDLAASVTAAMRRHDVDYVPGCADLGDFDATSTAIAFDPTGAAELLPPAAVRATFERYWQFFQDRRAGFAWDAYTPYELRIIGAFVRLGWRERAGELLGWFLADQRPVGWRQWPEVVTRDRRVPRFLGDLPHTWVGADFLRSALDLFAYLDEPAQALVIGAGVWRSWLDEAPGVAVEGLRTPLGPLSYSMRRTDGRIVVQVGGGLTVPPGGIVVKGPWEGIAGAMTLDGRPVRPRADGAVLLHTVPARLEIATPLP